MKDVKLAIDEKEIPLNEIMKNMLSNIILGFVKTLKKVPEEINGISIEIKPDWCY